MFYTIKIDKTGRYINWCDEHWYQTNNVPLFKYTREECDKIFDLLRHHYVYIITLVGTDGTEIHLSRFQKDAPVIQEVQEEKKKSMFSLSRKISIKDLKNIKKNSKKFK